MTLSSFPQSFRIKEVKQESHDVYTLILATKQNSPFVFKPGQFNMLSAFGIGEAAISISSDPNNTEQFSHTIRMVGQVTNNLQQLKINELVTLRGPFGTPWPLAQAKGMRVLLIAGGIGVAPLRSVIYALLAQINDYESIDLIYGARTPDDLIFQDEIKSWQKKINVTITVDHAKNWSGNIAVVTQFIPQAVKDGENTLVMLCGPEIMMRFSYYALQEANVPTNNIYFSMERNMQCGIGHCGHCQWGPFFICKDGPVMNFKEIEPFFFKKEL
ncbi:MAG: FAD/NAD(P)-binding protein [Proteobacteria bacterium]|nr:FAD/NAD(P)-binding protein [Pseudomonadota bacterium]